MCFGLYHCKCTDYTSNKSRFKSRYHSHEDSEKSKDQLPHLLKIVTILTTKFKYDLIKLKESNTT